MARFEITAPDGARYEITAPDDASEAEVMSYAQKQFATQPPPQAQAPQPAPQPVDPMVAKGRANAADLERKGFAPSPLAIGASALAPGLVDKGLAGIEAGLNYVSGGKFGMPYDEALATKKAQRDRAWGQSPISYGAGAAAGILSAPAILPRASGMASGAATAGTYGAAYAAGEQDWSNPREAMARTLGTGAQSAVTGAAIGRVFDHLAPRAAQGAQQYQQALTENNAAAQAAQDLGVQLPRVANAGDTVAGHAATSFGGRLAGLPVIGSPLATATQQAQRQVGQAAQRIADSAAPGVTPNSAGETLRRAAEGYIDDVSRAQSDRLYGAVRQAVPDTMTAPLTNTRQAVAAERARLANAGIDDGADVLARLDNPLARRGGLNYQGMQDLRSSIGTIRDDAMQAQNASGKMAGRLYGPLTQDIEALTQQAGGQRARTLWNRANQGYRGISARKEALESVVGRSGERQATSVVDNVMRLARSKGGGDARRLLQIRKSVQPQEWSQVQSAAIQHLGGLGEQFSAAKFLTEFGKLSPEGRNALFGGRTANLAQDLERLRLVAERVQRIEKMGNPSGTAGSNLVAGLVMGGGGVGLFGLVNAAIAAVPGLAAGNTLARMMAQPARVRAMTQMGTVLTQVASGRAGRAAVKAAAAGLARHIAEEGETDQRTVYDALMRNLVGGR